MNLAIVVNFPFPGTGAANQAVHMQALGLSSAGVRVTVLTSRVNPHADTSLQYDIWGPRTNQNLMGSFIAKRSRILDWTALIFRVVLFILQKRFDWIVLYGASPVFVLPSFAAWILRQNLCFIQGDLMKTHVRLSPMQWLDNRLVVTSEWLIIKTAKVVSIGPSVTLEHHIRQIAPRTPLLKAFPPTDVDLFSSGNPDRARNRLGLSPYDPIVVHCGALSVLEGTPVLLQAFKSVSLRHPTSRLILAGPVSEFDAAAGAALDYHLIAKKLEVDDRVVFAGVLNRTEVADLLAAADCLVLSKIDHPNNDAASPIKIGEYLASGRPIVASRVCGLDSWLEDGKDVSFCPPGSSADLADCVDGVLARTATANGERGPTIARNVCDYRVWGKTFLSFLSCNVIDKGSLERSA